jgi:hypothetical protein
MALPGRFGLVPLAPNFFVAGGRPLVWGRNLMASAKIEAKDRLSGSVAEH